MHGRLNQAQLLLRRADGFFCSKTFGLLSILFCACCLAVDIRLCFSPALWLDTAYTSVIIEPSYAGMIDITAHDVHPPLYYILAKFFSGIFQALIPGCSAITAMKLFSVLPFVAMLVVIYTVVRREWGWGVAGLSALSVMSMPRLADLATEARMYSLAMFFVTSCYLAACLIIRKGTLAAWVSFALSGLAAAYTHTFACITVVPVYLLLGWHCLRNNRPALRKWAVSCGVAVIGFLPWLFVLIRQALSIQGDYWIEEPTLFEVIVSVAMPLIISREGVVLSAMLGLVMALLIISCWCLSKKSNDSNRMLGVLGIGLYLFVSFVGLSVSFISTPVFTFRYAYPAFACFWIGACLLFSVGPRILRLLFTFTLLTTASVGFVAQAAVQFDNEKEAEAITSYLNQHPRASIVTGMLGFAVPVNRYIHRTIYVYEPIEKRKEMIDSSAYIRYIRTPEALAALAHQSPYLVFGWLTEEAKLPEACEQQGLELIYDRDVSRYPFYIIRKRQLAEPKQSD